MWAKDTKKRWQILQVTPVWRCCHHETWLGKRRSSYQSLWRVKAVRKGCPTGALGFRRWMQITANWSLAVIESGEYKLDLLFLLWNHLLLLPNGETCQGIRRQGISVDVVHMGQFSEAISRAEKENRSEVTSEEHSAQSYPTERWKGKLGTIITEQYCVANPPLLDFSCQVHHDYNIWKLSQETHMWLREIVLIEWRGCWEERDWNSLIK